MFNHHQTIQSFQIKVKNDYFRWMNEKYDKIDMWHRWRVYNVSVIAITWNSSNFYENQLISLLIDDYLKLMTNSTSQY